MSRQLQAAGSCRGLQAAEGGAGNCTEPKMVETKMMVPAWLSQQGVFSAV